MGTAGRHKVQVFSSDVVEELRTLLTQKTTEPVPQPDSFMIGAVIQALLPLLVELRRKGYSLNMLAHVLEEKGVRISSTALSGYLAKFARPVEDAPVRGTRRERTQTSTSASLGLSPWLTQTVKTPFAVRCKFLDRQDYFNAF